MKRLFFTLTLSFVAMSIAATQPVDVSNTDTLTVYHPNFSSIDLATGSMPGKSDNNVIFTCAAAFTGELLDEFFHNNIAGNHVSGGKFFKGYKCDVNTGAFTFHSGKWSFHTSSWDKDLHNAAEHGGMGFSQNLIVDNGKRGEKLVPIKLSTRNQYRALCKKGDELYIIDSTNKIELGEFINALISYGVEYALYLDMGTGWNYSWYRDADGNAIEIHKTPGKHTTNWIVFYK